ncbi:acetyl/propionyl/methylcrotonyl-CoA carboxylase subunit alpha [Marinobacter salarius]|uniref:acetyl/propionyl/methylcrotonyl-CoA carboxylase subunit alpha n=1 Tax=Marinobacter salarius TaxID=1420917 RepID=UPI0010AAD843|nr:MULTISPECIES: acetyl/propionyl/methylcrotonyl-CoA carboxylase subunit alpha [Marinobacter]MDP4531922.1 acetyl/propionyl/methylcrotonyl-CoA carboxylase subunit alpha [Marinobacter salarius]HIO28676.1 acetyl/propionyl/methylcrotonyl-CoA carboxylase subunit alpha [Marinobacter salarius]HIP00510.1 acetyl/propionyl/methylcrotonyl-CoA carboxylase subunit alpha [Marinobacter salarius]
MLKKLLIANRGEIAVRVVKTAKSLGYRTVAVYSEADAKALHVELADEAVCIGPAQVSASYLNAEAIIEAARKTGADCVHPGYGFLSENSGFARACKDAGLVFVGPPEAAIELMGSKRRSKIAMQEAGVPVVPGFEGDNASDEELINAAENIGYPLMIKASAGGGGRGMRLVEKAAELADNIQRARSEAKQAFGDGELILEKAVIEPRHIEIQIFADQHGNAVYLGERDCSVQRRHQKVVEEAPSPFVTPELRQAMGEAAVKAALACGYEGAGTVEFLVDKDRNFYFLEMNTRLQVEHPVTELITGQDLVAWQLSVAEGLALPLTQDQIQLNGHAIEVRLYAEDPANGFTPQTGQLQQFQPAKGEGLRFDTGVRSGDSITPHYDPMLAKVIAWGANRNEARRRLLRALEDTTVFGVTTNRYFLSRIIADDTFGEGEATTAFLQQAFKDDPSLAPKGISIRELALAACVFSHGNSGRPDVRADLNNAWSNAPSTVSPMKLDTGDKTLELLVRRAGNHVTVTQGEEQYELDLESTGDGLLCIIDKGVRQRCQYHCRGDHLYLQAFGQVLAVRDVTHQPASGAAASGSGRITATMDGAIIDVLVQAGQAVKQGDTLVILEAMKMEHPVKADRDGTVGEILATKGDQVKRSQLLVEITATDATSEEAGQ